MTKEVFQPTDLKRFADQLSESRLIIITCHLSPDGDALGASLGLQCFLSRFNPGARVFVVTPDEPTHSLSFLPGFNKILPYSRSSAKVEHLVAEADTLVCLDFNELARTDLLAPCLRRSSAVKILVDHHLNPEHFADIEFSYPRKAAASMLLFEIIVAAGLVRFVDGDVADCFLTGMMTDTGDFSYNVSDPAIYSVIGKLISVGADKARLTRLLFNTFSERNLRIQGFALAERMEVFPDRHAALITLSRDDLNRFGYKRGDTEGLVNKPLAIPGILYSCYLREETDYIKVSMRSLGNLPVNEICSAHFNGGGHRNAAGGEFPGSMEECSALFRQMLDEVSQKHIDPSPIMQKIIREEKNWAL